MVTGESRWNIQSFFVTTASIFTICVGIYTIYNFYSQPTTELQATVDYGTYVVDPWTSATLLAKNKKLEAIVGELKAYRISGGKLSAPLEEDADSGLNSRNYDWIVFDSTQTHYYSRTVVSEKGDLGATGVSLRIPDAVGSLVIFDDGSKKVFGRSPTISLGDLKPEEKVTVYSWFTSPPILIDSANIDISLAFAKGIGAVEVRGLHSFMYQMLTSTLALFWYALFAIWSLGAVWRMGFKQGRDQSKLEPTLLAPSRSAENSE